MRSALDSVSVYPAGAVVTPHDENPLPGGLARGGLWVGGAGDVTLIDAGGNTLTIAAVAAGSKIPIQTLQVLDTGTDATSIVALYTEAVNFA